VLTEGELDEEKGAECEGNTEGDAWLLAVKGAETVPAAPEALGADEKELPALLEGELRGELVALSQPVGAASEADELTELLVLWVADKDAGKGEVETVAQALGAVVALPPPLAEAASDKDGRGEKEAAPVGDAVEGADADTVAVGEELTRAEKEAKADAVSTAGESEGKADVLAVGVPGAVSVGAPLPLASALLLAAPEAVLQPVRVGRVEKDSVGAGDTVTDVVGDEAALAVDAPERLPCAFAV
jgi:hypothetical protein